MAASDADNVSRKRLDAARQALLERRRKGAASGDSARKGIESRNSEGPARASFAQSRLWFLDRLYDATPAYHMYRALRVRGSLDDSALRRALDGLVERHESLRTAFVAADGELFQEVVAPCPMPFNVVSLEDTEDAEKELASRLPDEVARSFDLSRPPLMRATLFRIAVDEQVLLLTTHHIVSDEWSNEILADELAERYRAYVAGRTPELPETSVTYADYAEWQRERVAEIREDQLAYWRDQLAGELPPLDMPLDHSRPLRPSLEGGLLRRTVSTELGARLEELTRTAGVTSFILLLTAFKVLLHRYTGQTEIVVGVPAANRGVPQIESLVGLFLNTLVLRSYPDGDRTFVDYLGEVRDVSLQAYENQEVPLELLVAELQPDRDLSHNPLFQVMFVHSSDSEAPMDFGALECSDVPLDPGVAKFDLTVFTAWHGDELELRAEYSTDLFDATTIESLLSAYSVLLESIVSDPKLRLDSLPLLTDLERAELNAALVGPEPRTDRDATWLHTFEAAIEQHPDAPAATDSTGSITYSELDRRTRAIATALVADGVEAGDYVGVYMGRSTDQIASVLGVMRAGAAYVPLDPSYPAPRITAILRELSRVRDNNDIRVLLSNEARGEVPEWVTAIALEDIAGQQAATNLPMPDPDAPAYAIFTSGSTGSPKGVSISHANLAHSNAAREEYYDSPVERFLLLSSFSFDSSVAGIFWTLGSGGTLLLGPPGFERDPRQVAELVQQHSATHTLMLPALYELLLEIAPDNSLATLRTVIVAGEACGPHVAERHARMLREAALYNEYGPTEASVWATVYKCTGMERDSVPIGLPVAGVKASLRDANLNMVPKGAAGELCIAGPGVSRGYIGRPELTSKAFIANPDNTGEVIYRTGDRARIHDGQLRYLGRTDEQIKVRGYRIEPAEVVTAILQAPDIVEAAVLAVGTSARERQLAAYVVARNEADIDVNALRRSLKANLPPYMIPSLFVPTGALPRLPNGKLDVAKLPEPEAPASAQAGPRDPAVPGDEVLEKVLAIWRRALGEIVGPEDNFFDVGGHSLLGVSLIMSIEQEFGVELPLAALFEAPTPAGLAERVRDTREEAVFRYVIPVQPNGSKTPIFCIHGGARLLAENLDADQPIYLVFHDTGEADPEFESVETVAAAYLEEIRRVQPEGPYYLCGFSYGGMLAYEIATRLRDEGESMGLLTLLDPPSLINTSLLELKLQHKLGEMHDSGSRLGFFLGELPRAVWRRVRRLWRETRWAYYRTAGRTRFVYGTAALVAGIGLAALATTSVRVNAEDWQPVSESLPIVRGQTLETDFSPGLTGLHEIELAVDRVLPRSALETTVAAQAEPSELDVRWSVWRGDEQIAGATATDYHYLDLKPHTVFGKFGYLLFRIPLSRSAEHRNSLGLRGEFTWARGMGAARLNAGETYTLRAEVGRSFPQLDIADPHINLRFNRRAFHERRDEVVMQGFAGLALLGLAALLAAAAWLRRHQTIPPRLIAHRNLKHNMRLSQRYDYPPYPGAASLILPERHSSIAEDTISSWRSVIQGELQVDVIKGTRRHIDLIKSQLGAEVSRLFAKQLQAAQRRHAGDTATD